MSIKIECRCGQKTEAGDEFKGKTIACPKCGQKLLVGSNSAHASGAAGATVTVACQCGKRLSAPAKLMGKRIRCPGCGQGIVVPESTRESTPIEQLFDEEGINASQTGRRCPQCGADMGQKDIICIDCGFNSETGKRLKTKRDIID